MLKWPNRQIGCPMVRQHKILAKNHTGTFLNIRSVGTNWRFSINPWSFSLNLSRKPHQRGLVAYLTNELYADWNTIFVPIDRNRDRRLAGPICDHRKRYIFMENLTPIFFIGGRYHILTANFRRTYYTVGRQHDVKIFADLKPIST